MKLVSITDITQNTTPIYAVKSVPWTKL